jgi:hypothetical protein
LSLVQPVLKQRHQAKNQTRTDSEEQMRQPDRLVTVVSV